MWYSQGNGSEEAHEHDILKQRAVKKKPSFCNRKGAISELYM